LRSKIAQNQLIVLGKIKEDEEKEEKKDEKEKKDFPQENIE